MRKILTVILCLVSLGGYAQILNIKDYGAVGDGRTLNSEFIQKAIDAAHAKGGGKVLIPQGTFLTGTVHLKSGVTLVLDKDAILLGSTNLADYERYDRWYALVIANKQENIGITGQGTIDGQGKVLAANVIKLVKNGAIKDPLVLRRPNESFRPQLIELQRSNHIRISGITLKNASCWVQTYNLCNDLTIDSIKVRSTAFWNNDGIDVVDCKNTVIKNSDIDAADDGICLKSSDPTSACENIDVHDCRVRSSASAIKFGTASLGGFKKIKVNNIYCYNTYRVAVALEIVDGGIMEDIDVSNITGKNMGGGIFVRLGQRKQDVPPGIIRRVHIKNVNVQITNGKPDVGYDVAGPPEEDIYPHNLLPAQIVGLPGHPVQDITFDNVNLTYGGGADRKVAFLSLDSLAAIPEMPKEYPEFSMFGELPAWALYTRHAEGVVVKNSTFKFDTKDFRAAMVFDDVKGLQLNSVTLPAVDTPPAVVLRGVSNESIKNLKTPFSGKNAVMRK